MLAKEVRFIRPASGLHLIVCIRVLFRPLALQFQLSKDNSAQEQLVVRPQTLTLSTALAIKTISLHNILLVTNFSN